MKICIIGAGIYGCHIATFLKKSEIEVVLLEKENEIFTGASGNNQFRLHLGYHYARDFTTRQQSKLGFDEFLKLYDRFTIPLSNNYYVVPKDTSLIDYHTYVGIFKHENFDFQEVNPTIVGVHLNHVEGAILVNERVVCINKLKLHFEEKLQSVIRYNVNVTTNDLEILKSEFDYVIDCTWGKLLKTNDSFFEVTHLCYIELTSKLNHPALTFVDGAMWSIYPTEKKGIYTLSSVTHTPLYRSANQMEVYTFINNVGDEMLLENFNRMKEEVEYYYPAFSNNFQYLGNQISIKTKPIGNRDPRDCRILVNENLIGVLSGKLDSLSFAEEKILSIIK